MGKIVDREHAAWNLVIDGAESYVEDWIDEEGEYAEDEVEEIRQRADEIISLLRDALRYPGIRAHVWA